MRKDGKEHQLERRVISPSVSPKTVKTKWLKHFNLYADQLLNDLSPIGSGDLIRDYAMPLSAEALKLITGLMNMEFAEMADAADEASTRVQVDDLASNFYLEVTLTYLTA